MSIDSNVMIIIILYRLHTKIVERVYASHNITTTVETSTDDKEQLPCKKLGYHKTYVTGK